MHRSPRLWMFTVCLLVAAVSLSGCEPLRKKFTRKKKEDKKEELNPILDPIDYPPSRISADEKYRYYYSLWQVWNKDLLQMIGEPTMDKRKNYLLGQITQQLEEMKHWIPEAHAPKIGEALSAYDKLAKEMEKPEMMRSITTMEMRLRRAESFIKNELKPDVVFPKEEQ